MDVDVHVPEFLNDVEKVIEDVQTAFSNTSVLDKEDVEELLQIVEVALMATISIEDSIPLGESITEALQSLWSSLEELLELCFRKRGKGRPEILIREEQLVFLLGLHFTLADIARLYNVSSRTVRRRVIQFELEDNLLFFDIPDTVLDDMTKEFVSTHPNSGARSLAGFLRSMGYRIQRQRVRESLQRVDPRGGSELDLEW